MKMEIMLWCLLASILTPAGEATNQVTNKSPQSFRIIPIQKREHGYSNFASIAIMSRDELDSFLEDTSEQIGWNNRQEFEDSLRNAKLDFAEEALVLLRHTEASGSVQVTFETPILQDRKLLCEIRGRRFPPGYGGTADMAYYCFAVVVSKSAVSQVELQAVEGGFSERLLAPIIFPIIEKGKSRDAKPTQSAEEPVTQESTRSALECSQSAAARDPLLREAIVNQYWVRRVEFSGNQYTRDEVLRRRIMLEEGDVFTRENLVRSLKSVSKLKKIIYPIKLSDVIVRLNSSEKTIDITICFRERPRYRPERYYLRY